MSRKHLPVAIGLLSAAIALALATNVQATPRGDTGTHTQPSTQPQRPAPKAAPATARPDGTSGAKVARAAHAAAQDAGTTQTTPATQTGTQEHKPQQLETVVVTARLRSEDIQKVPIAISAFSASDLRDLQAVDVTGLQGAVPNLNIVQGRGSSSNVNIFIRGIGQPDALQSFDPGVGFYVDDVYYSRINGALLDLFDVDHIEVLRGPQGTLYGMNSTGGAVKVVTKKPSDKPVGSVGVTVGTQGRINTQAYLSGPLGQMFSGSLAIGTFKNHGYITDPDISRRFNGDDTQAARGKLEFHPSDTFKATLALDYSHQNTPLTMGHPTAPLMSTDLGLGTTAVLLEPSKFDYHAHTSFGPDKGQKLIHKGAALHLDWNLAEDWELRSITAYRKLDTAAYIDIDASQFELGDVLVELFQHQLSQEFQLHYDNHDNLHAVVGLYYLNEHVPSHQEAYADDFLTFFGTPLTFLRTIDDNLVNKSYAGFANATWTFDHGWSVTGGVRYTHEKKDYSRTTSTFFGPPFGAANATFAFSDSQSWNAWTPSLSLQKQFSPELMWYVSANRGFKSGGFNGRANTPAEVSSFDPEFVWTYESGLKFRSNDGRAQASTDVFYSNYKDFQARVSSITNPGATIPNFSFPVLNAAKLTMYGAEFQGSILVGEATNLQAQVGYLHAKYDRFDDPRVVINPALAGLHAHVAFSPRWTARLAATHTFGFSNGSAFTAGGDVSWRDTTWLSVDNRPGLVQQSYALVGLFGTFDSPTGAWQVQAGVRNLTDKTYKTDAQEFSSVGNIQTAYYGWPRNYYVSVRYNFMQ